MTSSKPGSPVTREDSNRDADLDRLRALMLEAEASPVVAIIDQAYFVGLRERIRRHGDATESSRMPAPIGTTENDG